MCQYVLYNVIRSAHVTLNFQAYFEYGRKADVCRLNYHLLTIAVMKKLNGIPYEHHCKWSLGVDSILDVAFTHIEHRK